MPLKSVRYRPCPRPLGREEGIGSPDTQAENRPTNKQSKALSPRRMKSGAQGLIGAVASQTTSCYRTCLSLVSLTLTTSCSQPVALPASLGMVLRELIPLECCLAIETREDNFTIRSSLYFSHGRCFGNLFSLTLFTMAGVLISPWPAILCARNWHSSLIELLHLLPSLPALLLQAPGRLGPPWRVVPPRVLSRLLSGEPRLHELHPICFIVSRESSHLAVYCHHSRFLVVGESFPYF